MKSSPAARIIHRLAYQCLILPALLILGGVHTYAQKATVRDGTILRDGEPYARVQATGSILHNRDFSFRTLDGKEFMMMYFDDAAGDYRVVFFPGEEQTRLPERYGSAAVMAQEIVDNHLVEGGTFNPAGLRRFMLAHPPSATAESRAATQRNGVFEQSRTSKTIRNADDEIEQAADEVSEAILNIGSAIERAFQKDSIRRAEREVQQRRQGSVTAAPRDKTAPVTVRDNELRQGSHMIGRFAVKTTARDGSIERSYSFHTPDGDVVAEATMPDVSPKSAEVVTMKDNRLASVPLTTWTQWDVAAEIAEWLVKRRYL